MSTRGGALVGPGRSLGGRGLGGRGGALAGRARKRPPARQALAPAPRSGSVSAGESLGPERAGGRRPLALAGLCACPGGPPPRVLEAWSRRGACE